MFLNHRKRWAGIAGLIAIFLWALAPALVKVQIEKMPLSYFLVLRYGLSVIFFSPVLFRSSWSKAPRSIFLWAGLAACLGIHLGFQVLALASLPMTWYVVLFSLAPGLSLLFLGTRWDRILVSGVLLSMLGTFVFVAGSPFSHWSSWGLFCLLVSVLGWAFLTLFIKKIQFNFPDLQITAVCSLVSFIVFLFWWILERTPTTHVALSGWVLIASLSFLVPIAFYLFSFSLRVVPVMAVFNQFLEPIFGVLIGCILLHEHLTVEQFIGMGLILVASFQMGRQKQGSETITQQGIGDGATCID